MHRRFLRGCSWSRGGHWRCVAIVGISFAASSSFAEEEPFVRAAMKDQIVAAWQAREASIESVSLVYRGEIKNVTSPDGIGDPDSSRLILGHGERIRFESPVVSQIGQPDRPSQTAYDGQERMEYWPGSSTSKPTGTIRSGLDQFVKWELLAPLCAYLPLEQVSLTSDNLFVNPGFHVEQGRRCVTMRTGNVSLQKIILPPCDLWLDADREFLPVRIDLLNGPNKFQQHDIEYEPRHGKWAIRKWKITHFGQSGAAVETNHLDVEECTFDAAPAADSFRNNSDRELTHQLARNMSNRPSRS